MHEKLEPLRRCRSSHLTCKALLNLLVLDHPHRKQAVIWHFVAHRSRDFRVAQSEANDLLNGKLREIPSIMQLAVLSILERPCDIQLKIRAEGEDGHGREEM